MYIKHNLFHQNELGRDNELQKAHSVLLKSHRYVAPVSTFSAKLGLGSELADKYRDVKSVSNGHLLNDLSPRTDDRIRLCTNTGSIRLKFDIWDPLKQPKNLDDEHTKSFYSQFVPIIFPQMQRFFLQFCPEEFIRFIFECVVNLLKRNLRSIKRHHLTTLQNENWFAFSEKIIWKHRTDVLASEKGLQLIKVITPAVINHLS